MNNKHFMQFMAVFSASAAIVCFYAALWYSMRDIFGIAALWGFLAVDMFVKTSYFVTRSKTNA